MLEERVTRVETALLNIERIVIGPPTLEDKMRQYAYDLATHKANNAKQDALDVRHELEKAEARRDQQHEENQRQAEENRAEQKKHAKYIYIGVGIVITLNALMVSMLAILMKH